MAAAAAVPVARTAASAQAVASSTPRLTPDQVKAAEEAGAEIIHDCALQYANDFNAEPSANRIIDDTFRLIRDYKIDPGGLYPNYIKPAAASESVGGIMLRAAFWGCPDGVPQDDLKAALQAQ